LDPGVVRFCTRSPHMASTQAPSDGRSHGSEHDVANVSRQGDVESAVGVAALTELERRMYEHSVGLRASPSIKELLQELCSGVRSQSSDAAFVQSARDGAMGRSSSWITQMSNVEEAIEVALCEESSEDGREPESEPDAMEAKLAQLQDAVRLQIVAPLLKAYGGAREQAGLWLMLPAFSYDVLTILTKTWHLARIRGQQVQRLKSSVAKLHADTKKAKQVKQNEELDTTSVVKVKKLLKEKSWALSRAQAKIEQLEGDRLNSEQHLLQLERAKQREASCREECERRLTSLQVDKHRRLTGAKDALQQAKEALADVKDGMRRTSEIKAAFHNCKDQLQEVEQQQQQQQLQQQQHQSHRGACSTDQGVCASLGRHSSSRQTLRNNDAATWRSGSTAMQVGLSSSTTGSSVVLRAAVTQVRDRGSASSLHATPGAPTTRERVKNAFPEPIVASALPIPGSGASCCLRIGHPPFQPLLRR